MIEPVKQFGICWHCNNLMVFSNRRYWGDGGDGVWLVKWKATCTSKNFENVAMYPSFLDKYSEDEYWNKYDHGGKNFEFGVKTCSKYEVLQ